MKIQSPLPSLLSTRADVARMMGLPPSARRKEISSAFGQATRCDAWLSIEEEPVVQRQSERWTVRVIRGRPNCRLELRQDTRGPWLENPDEIPQDVLDHLDARLDKYGDIISRRPWKYWEKCRWIRSGDRRLKARAGEVLAVIEIPNVARLTGEVQEKILLEPLCVEDRRLSRPVKLPLPVTPAAILETVEKFRASALGVPA